MSRPQPLSDYLAIDEVLPASLATDVAEYQGRRKSTTLVALQALAAALSFTREDRS
ncbi:hypothetical protein D3C86_2061100 [compost metagenome]